MILLTILVLLTLAGAKVPSHYCDSADTYVESECVYYQVASGDDPTSSDYVPATTGDACLVYKTDNYCIRCMEGAYLTPERTGQFCSYVDSADTFEEGVACDLSTYDSGNGEATIGVSRTI